MVNFLGFSIRRTSKLNSGCLKPFSKPFDTGWKLLMDVIMKIICFGWNLLLLSQHALFQFPTVLLPSCVRHNQDNIPVDVPSKNNFKRSHGSGRFSYKLRNSKKSNFIRRNCMSHRSKCQESPFRLRFTVIRRTTKPRRFRSAKASSGGNSDKWKWWKFHPPSIPPSMLESSSTKEWDDSETQEWEKDSDDPIGLFYQDVTFSCLDNVPAFVDISVPNVTCDFISVDNNFPDRFRLNFPPHSVFGHVLDGDDPLDEVDSWNEVLPSRKPRSVGKRKSAPAKTATKAAKQHRRKAAPRPNRRKAAPRTKAAPKTTAAPQQSLWSSAGHPKNRLYIDSGASVHIIFNHELLEGILAIDRPLQISAGGKDIHLSEVGLLHTALRHLPLPTKNYYYDETAIANLLSFSRIAEEYYVICNTRIDDAIYVQSKVDGKYL